MFFIYTGQSKPATNVTKLKIKRLKNFFQIENKWVFSIPDDPFGNP